MSEAAAATDVSEHQTQRGRAASGHSAHQLFSSPSRSRDSHEFWDCSVALCHCSGTFCPACTGHFLSLSTGLWDGSTVLEPRAGSSVVPSVCVGVCRDVGRSVVLVMARRSLLPVVPCAARHFTFLGALCLDTVWQKSLVAAGASVYRNMNI